jgi:hypothetical protein
MIELRSSSVGTKKMAVEKRRYARFENHSLSVAVARPGIRGIIRSNPTAECLNFSRTGLQFDCPQELNEGEKLIIDIAVDGINLNELKAEVVSKLKTATGDWCHGARFCLEEIKKDNVFHSLLLIEHRLKNSA